MKTSNYRKLLVTELDKIQTRVGKDRMQQIFREMKDVGQEAMSRELIVQLVFRHFGFWDRITFLMRHRDLIVPFLFRIKQTSTTETEEE